MSRAKLLGFVGAATLVLLGVACSNIVRLSPQQYVALADTVDVEVLDATAMSRGDLEQVLDRHEVLARFHARVRSGTRFDEDLATALEKGRTKVRAVGGEVLLYTRDSELVATIVQDARYAGPDEAVVMYALRRSR